MNSDFLNIFQIPGTTSLQVDLFLPEYNQSDATLKQKFTLIFEMDVLERIHSIFDEYESIIAFSDGSSIKNPGRAGCGVAFLGRPKDSEGRELRRSIDEFERVFEH